MCEVKVLLHEQPMTLFKPLDYGEYLKGENYYVYINKLIHYFQVKPQNASTKRISFGYEPYSFLYRNT